MSSIVSGAVATYDPPAKPSPAKKLSSTVKVGVVGYGYWGPNVVRNLQGMASVEVTAVCDKTSAARKRVHKNHPQIYVTTDASEVITSPEWSGIEAHGRRYSPFTSTSNATSPGTRSRAGCTSTSTTSGCSSSARVCRRTDRRFTMPSRGGRARTAVCRS